MVTPARDQFGTSIITLLVTDAQGASATDSFVLTVNPVSDAPASFDIPDQITSEDVAAGPIAFTVGDAETAAGNLVLSGVSSNPGFVPEAGILFGGSGSNRTVVLRPAPNQFGAATITVTVRDAGGRATRTVSC